MAFSLVYDIDKNFIQIYNIKNIKLFRNNLIDIALKSCQCIGQFKKHYLIPVMTVSGPESCFLLIFFANHYPMIGTYEFELSKLLR